MKLNGLFCLKEQINEKGAGQMDTTPFNLILLYQRSGAILMSMNR